MLKKALVLSLLALMPMSGCVVHTAPATAQLTHAWIAQVRLQIAPGAPGPRVASLTPSSWHRIRVSVGRVESAVPVFSKVIDPFDGDASRLRLASLRPGDGYWVQTELLHLDAGGAEWVIGSGRLGGNGQSVLFNPGPNAVPMPVAPLVAGGRLDAAPTPIRRAERTRTEWIHTERVIIIGSTGSPDDEAAEPIVEEPTVEESVLDWLSDDQETQSAPDSDESEDSDSGSDESDSEAIDVEDLGDWSGGYSALRQAPGP